MGLNPKILVWQLPYLPYRQSPHWFRLEVYLKRGGSKISKICKKQFGEKEVYWYLKWTWANWKLENWQRFYTNLKTWLSTGESPVYFVLYGLEYYIKKSSIPCKLLPQHHSVNYSEIVFWLIRDGTGRWLSNNNLCVCLCPVRCTMNLIALKIFSACHHYFTYFQIRYNSSGLSRK